MNIIKTQERRTTRVLCLLKVLKSISRDLISCVSHLRYLIASAFSKDHTSAIDETNHFLYGMIYQKPN